ncbi:MAG: electron transporter RnfB, partial [Erysipelotrichaceae bacterium]|nr:electron transporter RnfB [Erysipelotrichaceae bacterium]
NCKPCKKEQREAIIQYLKETPGPDGSTITLKG